MKPVLPRSLFYFYRRNSRQPADFLNLVSYTRSAYAGKISFKNLKRVAKELGENMTDEELQEMIDEADRDGDGEVSEEEFIRIMKKTSLY